MFKNAIKVSSHNDISGKDRKKLKKDLIKAFDTQVVDQIFIRSQTLAVTNLQGSKIQIISDEDDPLFVDSTSKKDYFPTNILLKLEKLMVMTSNPSISSLFDLILKSSVQQLIVYCVNNYPDIAKNLLVNQGVDAFLKKGANLMWPGVANIADLDPESINPDDVIAIRDAGTNQVIAIGALACSIYDVQATEENPDKKAEGIAAYILHVEGDSLWKAGGQTHNKPKWDKEQQEHIIEKAVKKQAKKAKKAKKKKKKNKGDDWSQSEEEEGDNNEDMMMNMLAMANAGGNDVGFKATGNKNKGFKQGGGKKGGDASKGGKKGKKGKKGKGAWGDEEEDEAFAIADDQADQQEEQNNGNKNKRKGKKTKKKGGAKVSREEQVQMDEAIMEAFLNAAKVSIDGKDFPIESGKFWSDHMIPCKGPECESLDFKTSSYKKIGKFLNLMAKKEIIEYQPADKKNPTPQILKINYNVDVVADFRATIDKPAEGDKPQGDEDENLNTTIVTQFKVEMVVKFRKGLWDMLNVSENTVATPDEAHKMLMDFLRSKKLLEGKNVIINEDVVGAFGQGIYDHKIPDRFDENDEDGKAKVRDENSIQFDKIEKSILFDLFNKLTIDCHRVTDQSTRQVKVKQAKFKGLTIIAEKSKNRFFTKIIGLENFGLNPEMFTSILANRFNCSVTTGNVNVGKNGPKVPPKEVIMQGTFIDEVKDLLMNESKIPEEFIEENNKTGKRKKKQQGGQFG